MEQLHSGAEVDSPLDRRRSAGVPRGASVVLAIPCFNEAGRLPTGSLTAFVRKHPSVSLLLVDDGSTDGTPELLRQLARAVPEQIAAITLDQNRGKGEAVRAGLCHALKQRPHFIGFWDADLAAPLEAFEMLVTRLERRPELWMAMGSRVSLLGGEVRRNALRHGAGRLAASVAARLLGEPVYDTQCGAKLLRVGPETPGLLKQPFITRWTFDLELLLRIAQAPGAGLLRRPLSQRVHEVPLSRWRDIEGSRIRPRDVLWLPIDFARIWARYRRTPQANRP